MPGKEITSMEPSRLRVGKGKLSPPKEHVGAVIREKRKENPRRLASAQFIFIK